MSSQPVPQGLRNLLADVFNVAPEKVTPELSAGSIEAWDSVGHLQAVLALETEYGIQFDPNSIAAVTSVSSLQSALEAKGVLLA